MNSKPQLNNPGLGSIDSRLLIRQAQAGDLRAFEELVVIYQDKIVTLSYYLTGNQADAQDLAQEVLVQAYTKLRSFRREADLGTWLHRITVNLWSNMQRRQKFPNLLSLDDPVQTGEGEFSRTVASDDPEGDPEEAFEGKELQESVRQALRSLSEEYRIVLVLREIEGYSYEEIAKITGCSLGTVKSRMNRARQALREKIEVRG
ncbi:MAG: sigma-70 family RNA polymerase sigma factor [Thermacetogeniaceae bacterium]